MSGHSHFASIKHKKAITDAKRSKVFSKLSREISVAAREGGGDPNFNPKLRTAIEKAKEFDMPADNIEKAVKRGTGELEGAKLESVTYEAYGPSGIAIIIEGITDNKNRTLSEIKQILNQNGGKLVGEGGVRWMFQRKPAVHTQEKDGRLEWVPQYEVELQDKDKEAAEKLFEALDENDAVQEIYSNLK